LFLLIFIVLWTMDVTDIWLALQIMKKLMRGAMQWHMNTRVPIKWQAHG